MTYIKEPWFMLRYYLLFLSDDLWIVSRDLSFELASTFLAKSTYYGPTSGNEVEIEPISRFSPSNWNNEGFLMSTK